MSLTIRVSAVDIHDSANSADSASSPPVSRPRRRIRKAFASLVSDLCTSIATSWRRRIHRSKVFQILPLAPSPAARPLILDAA